MLSIENDLIILKFAKSIDKNVRREWRELTLTEKGSQVSLSFVELLGVFKVASNIDKIEEYSKQHEHDNDIENIWLNWKSIYECQTDGGDSTFAFRDSNHIFRQKCRWR